MALTVSDLTADTARGGDSRMRAPARTGAEAIFQLLVASGVDYVFLNPGTDTAPLQEALVALAADGERVPTLVPCLYENVAMAAAHGYFLVTRKPQLVVVHVDVGTQNLGGNVHDAMRGQAGVVILAGRAPYTLDGSVPGGRDRSIQGQQDVPDQIGIVRGYAKWAHELTRVDTLHQLIPRAVQIAASEPAGPVYMTAAREVLMQPPDGNSVDLSVARRSRPLGPRPGRSASGTAGVSAGAASTGPPANASTAETSRASPRAHHHVTTAASAMPATDSSCVPTRWYRVASRRSGGSVFVCG